MSVCGSVQVRARVCEEKKEIYYKREGEREGERKRKPPVTLSSEWSPLELSRPGMQFDVCPLSCGLSLVCQLLIHYDLYLPPQPLQLAPLPKLLQLQPPSPLSRMPCISLPSPSSASCLDSIPTSPDPSTFSSPSSFFHFFSSFISTPPSPRIVVPLPSALSQLLLTGLARSAAPLIVFFLPFLFLPTPSRMLGQILITLRCRLQFLFVDPAAGQLSCLLPLQSAPLSPLLFFSHPASKFGPGRSPSCSFHWPRYFTVFRFHPRRLDCHIPSFI